MVNKAADALPARQQFALGAQIRRSSISVPSNIAEGAGRHTTASFYQFLSIALGSLHEVDTQIEIAVDLDYLEPGLVQELRAQLTRTHKTLIGLMRLVDPEPRQR